MLDRVAVNDLETAVFQALSGSWVQLSGPYGGAGAAFAHLSGSGATIVAGFATPRGADEVSSLVPQGWRAERVRTLSRSRFRSLSQGRPA